MKTISLNEYAKLLKCEGEFKTLQDIQEYVEDWHDCTLWDYPLEELQDILDEIEETKKKFVFVNTEIGIRICEI